MLFKTLLSIVFRGLLGYGVIGKNANNLVNVEGTCQMSVAMEEYVVWCVLMPPMDKETEWLLKEKHNGEKTSAFFDDCERLKSGEPLAYVIGFVHFLDTKIWLDAKPLIPRPETEYWVKKAIETVCAEELLTILDMCAGSGAIGVAVAKARSLARVDFVEINTSLHSNIIRNICDNAGG